MEGRKRGETNRVGLDTLRAKPARVTQRIGYSLARDAYHGRSELVFNERNSINVSYWYEDPCFCASPNEAYTGTLGFHQSTFNLDIKYQLRILGQPI